MCDVRGPVALSDQEDGIREPLLLPHLGPRVGHITIKMAGHPPFGAQVMLNGHEYVACRARKAGLNFSKEGNCFTQITDAARLAKIADTLADKRTIGRLNQVCERWIYSTCLCFALDVEEQERTDFHYDYSIYQVEYSRNLLFARGSADGAGLSTDGGPDACPTRCPQLRTLFGTKRRPHWHWKRRPRLEVVLEASVVRPSRGPTIACTACWSRPSPRRPIHSP